jgi:hypothetical protein
MVHASRGSLPRRRSISFGTGLRRAHGKPTLDDGSLDWDGCVVDYSRIRDLVQAISTGITSPFRSPVASGILTPRPHGNETRRWARAVHRTQGRMIEPRVHRDGALILATIRKHDEYNTGIYGLNDRYRGITGRRDEVFVNERYLEARLAAW